MPTSDALHDAVSITFALRQTPLPTALPDPPPVWSRHGLPTFATTALSGRRSMTPSMHFDHFGRRSPLGRTCTASGSRRHGLGERFHRPEVELRTISNLEFQLRGVSHETIAPEGNRRFVGSSQMCNRILRVDINRASTCRSALNESACGRSVSSQEMQVFRRSTRQHSNQNDAAIID